MNVDVREISDRFGKYDDNLGEIVGTSYVEVKPSVTISRAGTVTFSYGLDSWVPT